VGRSPLSQELAPTGDRDPAESRIAELLTRVRAGYRRVEPREAADIQATGGLLVDIRPTGQRAKFGEIAGAVVIERNVLEWRLDPTSPDRLAVVTGPDQSVVVVCQAGYASTLAAASLRQLGLANATDLVGGFEAWVEAGLPATPGEMRQFAGTSDG
jgi:rhodanese-related sulfurtransferase